LTLNFHSLRLKNESINTTKMAGNKRNIYKDVPISILKRYVLNQIENLDAIQLSRVYEVISSNTCIQETKEHCVNILVHKEHNWK
jgi:hypothetical protein